VERIYTTGRRGRDGHRPAITLCHGVMLCLEKDALLHVVAEFPRAQRTMRAVVVRVIFKDAVINYSRAVRRSVRGIKRNLRLSHGVVDMLAADPLPTNPHIAAMVGRCRFI
jgi:hypothetical protein